MRLIGILLVFVLVFSARAFVEIISFTCEANEKLCMNNLCFTNILRNRMSLLNFNCFFTQPQSNIWIHIKLFKFNRNTPKQFAIDICEDFCRAIEKTSYSQMFARLMPKFYTYGNFSQKCPMKGNVSISGLPLNLEFMPALLNQGKYLMRIFVWDKVKNLSIISVDMKFEVRYFKIG